jgi:F-type H+-transporting ATPase subunit delta
MAELATVARPYAEALFRVAKSGNLSDWSNLVSEMAQVSAHPDVKLLVENPNLTNSQVIDTFLCLLKSGVSDEAKNFIETLVINGRVSLLPEIAAQFHDLMIADSGSADAQIISAFEMPDAQVGELLKTLEKKFGRKLNPSSVSVDSSLIGGVRVVVGDEVLDLSVRAKLQQMHVALVS